MKHKFLHHRSGFTLVEMLIVIVIIGILASALIPRLSQARERANDTARKAHIQNIATVLIAYQIDKGSYPGVAAAVNDPTLSAALLGAGLSSIPTDPDVNRSFVGVQVGSACSPSPAGQYMYTPIAKMGISAAGFLLMAGTQTEGGSNYVFQSTKTDNNFSNGCITSVVNFSNIPECQSFTQGGTAALQNGTCTYNQNSDHLRYIYKQ